MFSTYVIMKAKLYDQPQHILLFGLIWDDKCSVIYLKKSNTIPFPSKYFKVLSVPWTCLPKKISSTYNIQKQLFQANGMSNVVGIRSNVLQELFIKPVLCCLCSLKLITKCVNGSDSVHSLFTSWITEINNMQWNNLCVWHE